MSPPTQEEAERIAVAAHVEAPPDGCDSCNGAGEALTRYGKSWLCELCMEKRLDREAAKGVAP